MARRRMTWSLVTLTCVVTVAPRYGLLGVLVVAGIGAGAVVFASWPYAVIGIAAALDELTAYLLATTPAGDWRHPALSDVMDPAFASAPTRGLLVLAWMAGGLRLLRLAPARAPGTARAPEGAQPWESRP